MKGAAPGTTGLALVTGLLPHVSEGFCGLTGYVGQLLSALHGQYYVEVDHVVLTTVG